MNTAAALRESNDSKLILVNFLDPVCCKIIKSKYCNAVKMIPMSSNSAQDKGKEHGWWRSKVLSDCGGNSCLCREGVH